VVFAAFADVGAGLAFLLLLGLSAAGLAVIAVRALLRPTARRSPLLYAAVLGLLQAWLVYLWAREALADSRRAVEWVWLGSLCVVIAALVGATAAGRQR
jgi:hypothetical protein